ncbi:MAG: hypothetical protein AB7U98_00155 [Candidatus Nitrosocosmicus sp.]
MPATFGHTTNQFENITIETGWSTEPPLVDEMNNIIIIVNRQNEQANNTTQSSLIPVRNALSQMDVMIKYGGITKQLNFIPSLETAGGYESSLIPSRIGSYSIILNGTIADQTINTEIDIEDVEGKQSLTFPPTEDSTTSGGASAQDSAESSIIGSNIRSILSGLENNIRTNSENMSAIMNNTIRLQESLNEQITYLNSLYIISVSSIGISIGAILISGFVLKKRRA